MKSKLKVLTIVGTRPEIIRLSRVMALLDRFVDHILVHTGQNYDYELNEIFFEDLEIRKPDHFLGINTTSLGNVLGDTLIKIEQVFLQVKPDAVLILGDTNASICGIMAKRMRIPIYHMEAGNRCFDFNVPEEINRRMIDHLADFNLVYTEHARRHLLSEGLPHRRIYLTGSPMFEVLSYYMEKIKNSDILTKLNLETKKYFLVSTHREENVDNPENLKKILTILNNLAEKYGYPVIVSTHPRTRKRIEALGEVTSNEIGVTCNKSQVTVDPSLVTCHPLISFLKPFGFSDYNNLQMNALCTISDSGTISEESAIFDIPAITIRNAMERPEAIDTGTIVLTGFDPDTVLDSISMVIEELQDRKYDHVPFEYQIKNTSWRVLKLIMGTAKLSNEWWSIKK